MKRKKLIDTDNIIVSECVLEPNPIPSPGITTKITQICAWQGSWYPKTHRPHPNSCQEKSKKSLTKQESERNEWLKLFASEQSEMIIEKVCVFRPPELSSKCPGIKTK